MTARLKESSADDSEFLRRKRLLSQLYGGWPFRVYPDNRQGGVGVYSQQNQ
jgi:hypothetical protein